MDRFQAGSRSFPGSAGATRRRCEQYEWEYRAKSYQLRRKSGIQLNQQLDFEKEKEKKIAIYKLPWKEWCLHKDGLGAMEADKASAVAVLHALHERFDVASQSIEVLHNEKDNRTFVVAACKVAANAIVLPPCVPKQSKVLDRTDHPYAVKMIMHVMRSTEASVTSQAGNILRVRTFFVLPEFKIPEKNDRTPQSRFNLLWILNGSGAKLAGRRCTRFGLCGG